jgi:hypothetical protein
MTYPDQSERTTQIDREQMVGGFPIEFIYRLRDAGGAWLPGDDIPTAIATDATVMKSVMEQMLQEQGVDIWFLTQFVDAIVEEGRVVGALVACEGGLHVIWCKAAVDASGDGDLAAKAGAEFELGRPEDNKPQPVTVFYMLGGVEFEKYIQYLKENPEEVVRWEKRTDFRFTVTPEMMERYYRHGWPTEVQGFRKAFTRAVEAGDYPLPYGMDEPYPHGALMPAIKGGEVVWTITIHCQDTGFGVNPTDRKQMRDALIAGRKVAVGMARVFKKYVPGFENCYLLETASILGIRESRRVIGDYMLSEEDARACRDFDDAVGRCGCVFDIHPPDPQSGVFGMSRDLGDRQWYQIPYGVLTPKGVDGLLVAGRCVSSSHIAHASMRHIAVTFVTGHAAGTAAAIAAKHDVPPRGVAIEELQSALKEQGAII